VPSRSDWLVRATRAGIRSIASFMVVRSVAELVMARTASFLCFHSAITNTGLVNFLSRNLNTGDTVLGPNSDYV
jgi:hypothetical protein